MKRIFLVEDSADCAVVVKRIFEADFEVVWAPTLKEARNLALQGQFDLLLLDVTLPDGSGFEFMNYLRDQGLEKSFPVLFLTAKDETQDKVLGFTLGADDYICKPFEPIELKLRVMARLKDRTESRYVIFKEVKLDVYEQSARLKIDDDWKTLDLTSTEFKLLHMFLKNPDKILPRDLILNRVWGEDVYLYPRIVDTYISKIRKKLEGSSLVIKSKNRAGYHLTSQETSAAVNH